MTPRPAGLTVRLSLTDRCQLRCLYCLPDGDHHREVATPLTAAEIGRLLTLLHRQYGIAKLRFTGGEPLLRTDLPALVAQAADLGIADIALTSNGQRLAPLAAPLKAAGLQRVNLSLDSLDPATFARITRGGELQRTLDGIAAARDAGLTPLKLNMVVMGGVNDHEVEAMLDFGLAKGCEVRFLEMMPVGQARELFDAHFVGADAIRARLQPRVAWQPLVGGASQSSRDFRVTDARGRSTVCGFITSYSHDFCRGCQRLRITASGELLGCLARGERQSLRPWLDDNPPALDPLVEAAFAVKRGHRFAAGEGADCMAAVGG